MALTSDKQIERTDGVQLAFPVNGTSKIYAGALVCVDADGYLVPGADTAGLIFQGIAMQQRDNASGDDGDQLCVVQRRGLVKCAIAAATPANIGDSVFLVDDETVGLAATTTNDIYCGIIAGFVDATHVWVDIEPAIRQADVATHIADASGAHAASAISIADAGAHFAAAESTVELALQKLAKTIVITLPRFTGWTKDGTAKAIALPAFELPVAVRVKRAYVALGTAPGADKTLALVLNSGALVSITAAATTGEAENLDIAIAADTDFALTANETASGSAANCDVMLVCQVDDGE